MGNPWEPRPPSRDRGVAFAMPSRRVGVAAAAEGQVSARRSSIFGAGPAVGAGVPGRAGREETAENRAPGGAREPLLILPDRKSFDHQLHGRASFLGVRRRQRRRRRDVGRLQVRVAVSAPRDGGTVDSSRCRGGARDGRAKSLCAHEKSSARARRLAAAGAAPGMASWRPGGMRGGPHFGHRCTRVGSEEETRPSSDHGAEMSRLALTTPARRVASSQRLQGLRVWRQSGGGRTGARSQQ